MAHSRASWPSAFATGTHPVEAGEQRSRSRGRFRRASQQHPNGQVAPLVQGLGWFSIALGLVEIVFPKQLGRIIGLPARDRGLLPVMGLREVVSGVGILANSQPTGWVWSRVAGDAIDLGLLGRGLAKNSSQKTKLVSAAAAVVGVTVLDVLCGNWLSRRT